MKKLYTQPKWVRYSRARQQDELRRRRENRRYKITQHRTEIGLSLEERWQKKLQAKSRTVKAPEDFSFINNPDGMCKFLLSMREVARKGKNVFIDLSEISSFTPETATILLSKMADSRFMFGMNPGGNRPSNPVLAKIFAQSGFYDYVQTSNKPSSKGYSLIHKKSSKTVEGEQAQELIDFATEKLFGERRFLKGPYRVFVEAMMNTHGHASTRNDSHETWWAMVYFDSDKNRAYFSFVDNGIGIFESVRVRSFSKRVQLFTKLKNNGDLLKDILAGKIGSRTADPRRGNGIPAMFRALQRGQISNFTIVANDVYGNIENDEYRILSAPFHGTFLYWEVSSDQ